MQTRSAERASVLLGSYAAGWEFFSATTVPARTTGDPARKGEPMALHNRTQPHLVERPCRLCRRDTPALRRGQMQDHPLCPECRERLAEEHRNALAQYDRQWNAQQAEARKARQATAKRP